MGDMVIAGLKIAAKSVFVLGGIGAFLVIISFAMKMIFVELQYGALTDLFALIQIGLPFNLNVILVWLVTGSSVFLGYRLMVVAIMWLNRWLV